MPKIILDDAQYEYEDLSESGKGHFDSIKYVEVQIQVKEQELKILSAAKGMYALALKKVIEGEENIESEQDDWIENLGDTIKFD